MLLHVHFSHYLHSLQCQWFQFEDLDKRCSEIYTTAEFRYLTFLSYSLTSLVVDLGDGPFAAPSLHQLVDGALAVTLEFVQVLVEDFAGTQCRHQVIKLPADLI